MAVVDTDFLLAVRTSGQALFDTSLETAPNDWQRFTTVLDTEGKKTLALVGLGQAPVMRTMKGTLEFGKVFEHDYTITVGENGVGIEIEEQAMMANPLSTITLLLADMIFQAAKFEMAAACAQLSSGFTANSFDGVTFYKKSPGHLIGDGAAHINWLTPVLDNAGANYQLMWQALNTAQGDNGQPLGYVPDVLVVHSNNRLKARQMLNASIIGNNSNVLVGDCDLIVTPFLGTVTEYHLLATGSSRKPIFMAEQLATRFVAQDGLDSDSAFERNRFRYKVDNKKSTGFGDPRLAIASDGTV